MMRAGQFPESLQARRSRERHRAYRGRHRPSVFGDEADPLLVSVRSGARISMPGMMDTVLNLGLNDADRRGPRRTPRGDARFAWDSYRRFIQMYADVVLELDHGSVRGSAGDREGG